MTFHTFIDDYIDAHTCYNPAMACVEAKRSGFSHQEALDILDFLHEFYVGGSVLD